jgi:hypothetical protein
VSSDESWSSWFYAILGYVWFTTNGYHTKKLASQQELAVVWIDTKYLACPVCHARAFAILAKSLAT